MSGRRRSSVVPPKDQTRLKIEKMEAEREQRRIAMKARKKERAAENERNIAAGNPGDVDFIGMVRKWRQAHTDEAKPHTVAGDQPKICICVRKRPTSDKERAKNDHDSITCLNPSVWVHSAKFRVDGIQKYLDHSSFRFDHSFDETVSTEDVYTHTTLPLLDFVCQGIGGRATVFAYGQTGSGKTYTMGGIQHNVCNDLFAALSEGVGCSIDDTCVQVSFFELYGGFIQDLLNERKRLKILEDGKGEINVAGLCEVEAEDPVRFFEIVEQGNGARTTHMTEANDTSSRSHAICSINLRDRNSGELKGKLSLVDLAGSERGTDTKAHNTQRRAESADINTSLLSLKECVRALDMNKKGPKHVPYRGSKLTLILKDCFTSSLAMTTMIATISPGASAADHTLNTLRYADRIKSQRPQSMVVRKSPVRQAPARNSSAPLQPKTVPPRSPKKAASVRKIDSSHENLKNRHSVSLSSPNKTPSRNTNARQNTVLSSPKRTPLSVDRSSPLPSPDLTPKRTPAPKTQTPAPRATPAEEQELRETVQGIFAKTERILNLHMSNIQENASILTTEGKILNAVQQEGVADEDIDKYVDMLEGFLERKEDMILAMQEKLGSFQEELQKEQSLSKKVGSLTQY